MKAKLIPGFTTEKELDILYELAKSVPQNGVIVEIGSLFGRTAVALAEGAPTAKIYCIDYFSPFLNKTDQPNIQGNDFWEKGKTYDREVEFAKFTKEYENIIPLKLDLGKIVYTYDREQVDLLFLDGAHKNPADIANLLYFKRFLKKDALICGHDFHDKFPDVIKNVKLLERMYKSTATLYQECSLWSIRIKE